MFGEGGIGEGQVTRHAVKDGIWGLGGYVVHRTELHLTAGIGTAGESSREEGENGLLGGIDADFGEGSRMAGLKGGGGRSDLQRHIWLTEEEEWRRQNGCQAVFIQQQIDPE